MTSWKHDKMVEAIKAQIEPEKYADVVNHGCAGGVSGFCYYSETTAFFDKHEDAIMDIAQNMWEDFGYSGLPEFLQSLNTNAVGALDTIAQIKNALVWVAVEEICRQLSEETEDCIWCGKTMTASDTSTGFCSEYCYNENEENKVARELDMK